MGTLTQNYQGPYLYPTTQAVPNSQQVVIPQITIPQTLTQFVPQVASYLPQQPGIASYKVKDLDEVKAFPTQPNMMYTLFLEDDDVFYVKTTDKNNYPTSLKRFRFFEEEEPVPAPPPEYVTVEEFKKFKEEIQNAKQPVRNQSANSNNGSHDAKQSGNGNTNSRQQ